MKFHPTLLALAALAALAGPAQALTYTYTGDTTGSPLWNRPLADFSATSSFGFGVPYDVLQFTVSQSGTYDFLSTSTNNFDPASQQYWDNFTFLYESTFNPGMTLPITTLEGGVNANDDCPYRSLSCFTQALTAGTTYFYVTTGFHRANYGAYVNTITGAGSVMPVPEPSSHVLMALGLAGVGLWARRRKA